MKFDLNKILAVLLLIGVFLCLPEVVLAQEAINNFVVNITAHQDGLLTVEEQINYDFGSTAHHGIIRNIPLVSKVGDLYRVIKLDFSQILRDGKVEPYSVDAGSQETEVKIGDADKTITGSHTYTIKYQVANGIGSNYTDHDEIYWNVTGDEWSVPIASASANLKTDFAVVPGQTICFSGSAGSTESNCSVFETGEVKSVVINKPLDSYQGLTFVSAFPINTFPKSTLEKNEPYIDPDLITFLKFLVPVYLILNLIVGPLLLNWYFRNKHKKRFGPPSVNFDLPEYPKKVRITPAEAGTIDNTKLDKDDVVATIFDLAIRKYLKIEQIKKKGKFLGLGSSTDHQLTKLREFDDLNDFEQYMLKTLLKGQETANLSDSKFSWLSFEELEEKNFKSLVARSFYSKNPKTQISTLRTLGIIGSLSLNIILGPVLLFLSSRLNGRTPIGDEVDWKIDGLKIFLKNMARNYKFQAENAYFVEKMIPYAMALGFIDEYMAQLKVLYPEYQPSWYSGSTNFYSSFPVFTSSIGSNITTSAPSSSSGFSGGSSGGGGGGGGGSSW